MRVSLIVACGKNREIGFGNKLLWHIPEDLKNFKKVTSGHFIVMGRKTYESIGRPLPNRTNIILTKQEGLHIPGCLVIHEPEDAFDLALAQEQSEIFIIGGGEIYQAYLPYASRIYLSEVDFDGQADTYFPKINLDEWEEEFFESHPAQDQIPAWNYRVLTKL